jgi:HemY protein
MIRALFAFALLVAVAAGIAWLADNPGAVTLFWRGYRVDTSVAALAIAAGLVAVAVGIVLRLWWSLIRMLRLSRQARAERRRRRGYRALTQGLVAVAAGDAEEAKRQARRADGLLGEPPLTMLLSAQAAQLDGDAAAARTYFTTMLERPETAFLGLRGLLNQALREGDMDTAMTFARRAYKLRPKTAWVAHTLADLQAHAGHWPEAVRTLQSATRHKAIGREEGRRKQAAALYGQSLQAEIQGMPGEALALMRKAHRLAPELVPATARLAVLLAASGQERRAQGILHKGWERGPHPDLARAYAQLRPGEPPLQRVRRLEKLTSFNPDHQDSHIVLATAALAADLWGEARRHLEAARERPAGAAAPRRVYRLMAEVEESERGDSAAAHEWLALAAEAEPDPAWVCERCGTAAPAWSPDCPHCDSFDSLVWGSPLKVGIGAIVAPAEAASGASGREPLAPRPAAGGVDAA